MIHHFKSYLKFLLASTNRHGVHSPFVYDIVSQCFYDSKKYPEYRLLHEFRKQLYADHSIIEITDFGAGSRVFTSNRRKISAIARNAGITSKRQRLLFRLVQYFQSEAVLELGTSLGLAAAAMALGTPNTNVITVEGCPATAGRAKEQFDRFGLDNIDLQISRFEDFFKTLSPGNFDLVYIDGNHDKTNTLAYFEALLPHLNNDSVVLFDDINWSTSMQEAWCLIRNHKQVTVSIDTFYWGLVFFRKEQEKEHFKIRL